MSQHNKDLKINNETGIIPSGSVFFVCTEFKRGNLVTQHMFKHNLSSAVLHHSSFCFDRTTVSYMNTFPACILQICSITNGNYK